MYNNVFDNTAAKRDLGFAMTLSYEACARRIIDYLTPRGLIENSDDDPLEDQVIAAWQTHLGGLEVSLAAGSS